MKFKIILIVVGLVGLYLYTQYAYHYNYITGHRLKAPADGQMVTEFKGVGSGDSFKILILGDSLSAGVGVSSYKLSYPYLIAENRATVNHQSVELVNLAVAGSGSQEVLKNQLPQIVKYQPDQIYLLIGVNDLRNLMSINQFKQNYQQILKSLSQQTKAQIVVLTIPYLGSDKTVHFPYNYLLDWRTKQFNQVITRESTYYSVSVIDLYFLTKDLGKQTGYYSADQFHPGGSGYQLWERLIDAN